jgi:hypothetical protein
MWTSIAIGVGTGLLGLPLVLFLLAIDQKERRNRR